MRCKAAVVVLAACAAAPGRGAAEAWFAAAGMRTFASAAFRLAGAEHRLLVGGRPGEVGAVALFSAAGDRVAMRHVGADVAYAADAAADGALAAVAMADGGVLKLALPDLAPVPCWRHGKAAVAVVFSPDGQWLASGGYDGVVLAGPVAGGAPTSLEHGAPVLCVQWSADGRQLAAGTRDGKVRLHDRGGRLLRTWNRLGGEVVAVAWVDGQVRCHVRASPVAGATEQVLAWP